LAATAVVDSSDNACSTAPVPMLDPPRRVSVLAHSHDGHGRLNERQTCSGTVFIRCLPNRHSNTVFRLAPVVLVLAAIVFAVGVAWHLADTGKPRLVGGGVDDFRRRVGAVRGSRCQPSPAAGRS